MPTAYKCEKCSTVSWNLKPSPGGELISRHVMRQGHFCPICGWDFEADDPNQKSELNPSIEPSRKKWWQFWKPDLPIKGPITCNYKLEPNCMEFLKRHARVHLAKDWIMFKANSGYSYSSRYVLAYSALKEFALAGALSTFNDVIGPIALLSSVSSQETLKYLCDLVASETGESLPFDQIHVEAFEIAKGSCVVITLPPPQVLGEPHMVGIVTDASLSKPTSKKPSKQVSIHYFSLERTFEGDPILCGWRVQGGRKNYQVRLKPQVGDFVDGIEQLWVSGNWKF